MEAPPGVHNLLCHGQNITSFVNLVRELPPKVTSNFERMSEWESIAVGKMKEVRSRQGKVLTLAHKALSENRVNDIDSDGLALEAINKTKEEVDDLLTKKSLLAVEIYDGIDNVLKKVERYVAKMDEDVLKVYGKPPLPLPLSRGSGVSKGGKGGSSSNKNKKLNPGGLEKPLNSGEAEFIDPSEPVYCYCREVGDLSPFKYAPSLHNVVYAAAYSMKMMKMHNSAPPLSLIDPRMCCRSHMGRCLLVIMMSVSMSGFTTLVYGSLRPLRGSGYAQHAGCV